MSGFKVKRNPNKQKPEFINPDGNAFIIGNGTTRKDFDLAPLMDHGLLFGCNYFYRDMHPHVLVLSDEAITNTVAKVDKNWMMRNHVYSWYPKAGGKIKKVSFPEKTSAGLMAVYEAIESFGAKKIFLIGMDFFGLGSTGKEDNGSINNMYVGKKHYAQSEDMAAPTYRNWQRRFQYVLRKYPDVQFYHVAPLEGRSPERLIGAKNWHQVTWEDLQNHLEAGTDMVDMKTVGPEDEALFHAENPDDIRAVLERQFSGQENYIYPDKIHPQALLGMKIDIQRKYREMGNIKNYLSVRIKEYDVMVYPIVVNTNRGQMLADDEFIIKSYQIEAAERYGKMGIKLEPFTSLEPKGDYQKPEELAPPPPPPSFGDIPPPPPPPVF